ncbi:gap junction beta-7 protein-like [Bombina bombina]|uniref:gap junction beta-7 protein-like n=1 Tax=Bombina bombina TaxID=8345 RepID=UPI00235A5601|nr:gap junction beta-7 protein-like [Bombina bombina]
MEMAVSQEVETINCLLSGVLPLASHISRAALAVLFFVRFGILAVGTWTIWRDEEKDFTCNSSRLLCSTSCFDEFSPISSFNLFSLQLVVLITHGLSVACYIRLGSIRKGAWVQFRNIRVQVKLHILWLLSRAIIEGLFIFTYCKVSGGFLRPAVTQCHSQLCEEQIICTDQTSYIKNILNLCICTASAASGFICLKEIVESLKNQQLARSLSYSPLLIENHYFCSNTCNEKPSFKNHPSKHTESC